MSNFDDMTLAIQQLKKYGPVSSIDDFFLKAIQMQEGEESEATELSLDARAFNVITNITDGGQFLAEILASIGETAGDDTEALAKAFYIVGTSGVGSDSTGILSGITMNDMLKTQIGSAATAPSAPTKNTPGLCSIQILPAMLNFGSRNTGAVEVFMNMIPTLEWSRAVPYLDVEIITPGPQVTGEGDAMKIARGISSLRFLNGISTIAGTADSIIAQAKSAAAASLDAAEAQDTASANAAAQAAAADAGQPAPADAVPAQYSSAGMEIFTSPQTMVPAWEQYASYDEVAAFTTDDARSRGTDASGNNIPWPGEAGAPRAAPIIDRMRPFMTMTGMNISIKPTRGMMSHKSAEIKVVLHDRSRLGEIGAFVKPSSFGQTELLVEWGWSHPDHPGGNGNPNNPYGLFINSLRTKEKFGVYNSKYTFKDDGQVEISLSCVTKGASSVNVTDVGISPEATTKYAALEALIDAISELRRSVLGDTPEMADVVGMSTISNLSPTNAGDMFSGEKFEEIQSFITAMGNAGGDTEALADSLKAAAKSTSEIQATIAGVIKKKMDIAKKTGDPYLKPRGDDASSGSNSKIPNHPSSIKDNTNWCSFGRMAALMIGAPLMETKRFNEVQMIFYTFNDKASFMFNQNIACFPIDLNGTTGFPKLFETWQKEKVQISVASFMGFVNRYYLSNMACKAYGFSNLFTRDEDGKAVIKDEKKASQLSSAKDAVLEKAYEGSETDTAFKLPRIRMIPECVPHRKPKADEEDAFGPQDTVLRLHFFDDSAAKYSGLHDILASMRNSEMGAVRSASNAVSSVEGTEDSDWGRVSAEFETLMSDAGLLEQITGTDFYQVKGGSPALKYFIKSNMPSITYGSQNCSLTNLSVGSMHNSADTTIHMIRAQRAGSSDSGTPGEQDRGLPLRMMPMQASGECMGCPILNHGQQFFIDMGTGTTVDNVYAVSGLDHSIEPGKFMTKFKLMPIDAFGKYESMLNQVDKAQALITAADK